MSSLDDTLHQLRRSHHETWAKAAARAYATPESDDHIRGIWEARELLDVAASVLASLRVDRPHDPDLADAERLLVSAHDKVYRVECARHRELGSVAPGERRGVTPAAASIPQPGATPARGPTGRR